ncbi:hypothetical protein BsWGS_03882 [Bradybaena similaris]
MRKMRSRDLNRQARPATNQAPLDNGQLPHGGYKGSKRHPLSILSFNKGAEFQQNIEQEVDRMLREEPTMTQCATPSWAILLHRAPSHSDESTLLANNLLTVSKLGQTLETKMCNQNSPQSKALFKSMRDIGRLYYRPNSTHQFLSATDLRDCAEDQVNVENGRPTRTTLLRDLQRRNSAGANSYQTRRDFLHRLHDLRNSSPTNPFTEFFKSVKPPEGEAFHSFLTGARYNRYSPALGCCFTEVKGHDVHAAETPPVTTRIPKQPASVAPTYRYRPSTTPGHRSRDLEPWSPTETVADIRVTPLKLKVVGNNLQVSKIKQPGLKLPNLRTRMGSPGKPSRCPEDASLAMYSTRSSSARAETDIENISDNVQNTLIASNVGADPGSLETERKAEPVVEDSEKMGKDDTEEKMLENLLTKSSGSLSTAGLPLVSLPSDIPASVGQDDGNLAEEEEAITLPVHNRYFPKEGPDNSEENLNKNSSDTDCNEFGNDFVDDKDYGCDEEGGDSDCLSEDADDSKVNNSNHYVLEGDEKIDNLIDKQFDNGMSTFSREADEVIKDDGGDDDDDDGSPEERKDHQELLGANSVPDEETATFFITEDSQEPSENVGEK